MNVYDYLFDESGFLYKNFLLGNKEELSYTALQAEALGLARYLREMYGQNNKILLVSPNSSFFLIAYLGIIKSGNVCVPLNPSIEKQNVSYIKEVCQSEIVFVAESLKDERWEGFKNVCDHIPKVNGGLNGFSQDIFTNDSFDENSLAEIIFTSGSMGKPKGVMISHKNIIANTDSFIDYLQLTPDDTIEIVLPFYYCYGLSLLHSHLKVGGSVVFNNNFMFPGQVLNDLKKYECTGFAGVPSHFQILLRKSTSFKTESFPRLRYVTQAGGKLHKVFIREFMDSHPEIDFCVMYGQTEATALLSYLPPDMLEKKLGSMGRPIPGVSLELVDDSGNFITDPDVVGELVARGNNIMLGYLGDEQGTSEILKNGWLHTGDLAYKDQDGYFFHTSRRKEIIKVGGRRISPKEIEEVIVTIPGVVDCSVSGAYDDLLGEALKAVIVLSNSKDNEPDEASIKQICADKLAPEKVPKLIHFSTKLAVAPTGKK